ncbi:uncharacterized protein LOC142980224 [Anticarsia gemmatalis]|uniref:uncharacterized protein LOC142980224 n=1 Tax=Anticarsia gemmatalis TaxID=129554 RepID=UPI003F775B21
MKFFVAFAALVAVSVAGPVIKRPQGAILGPAIVDFPVPAEPVVIGELPAGSLPPLVQVIINVNQADRPIVKPLPPSVVDDEAGPVDVDPVIVVDDLPVPIDPVDVVVPVLPSPAINIPDDLN